MKPRNKVPRVFFLSYMNAHKPVSFEFIIIAVNIADVFRCSINSGNVGLSTMNRRDHSQRCKRKCIQFLSFRLPDSDCPLPPNSALLTLVCLSHGFCGLFDRMLVDFFSQWGFLINTHTTLSIT